MKAKDLEMTYGVRIPVEEHLHYYVDTLSKSIEFSSLKERIQEWDEFEKSNKNLNGKSMKELKFDLIGSTTPMLNSMLYEKMNSWTPPEKSDFQEKTFHPEDKKFYISLDIREANWSVIKHFLGLNLPSWEKYTEDTLGFPVCLAKSKSFRQVILGQSINQKRCDAMQKYITFKHISMLNSIIEKHEWLELAAVYSDEIILKFQKSKIAELVKALNSVEWILDIRRKVYEMRILKNFNETVRVKEYYEIVDLDELGGHKITSVLKYSHKELHEVHGNRFYIHFKSLVLGEELDSRDMLFRHEHKTYRWCGKEMEDFREWEYTKKWMKPIVWKGDDGYIGDKRYYTIYSNDWETLFVRDYTLFEAMTKIPMNGKNFREVMDDYHLAKIRELVFD